MIVRTTAKKIMFGAATAFICGIPALGLTNAAPLVLYSLKPSLQPCLYIHTSSLLKIGTIAVFHVPGTTKRHRAPTDVYLHDAPLFMKPIVPGLSDDTHRRSLERVDVNSEANARIVVENWIDRFQSPMRQICRPISRNEFF